MSIAYDFIQECTESKFEYGDLEETIGFVLDHYSEALTIFREINKQKEEHDRIREDANTMLANLRNDEERWRRTKKLPKGFDKEEHQKRKEYFAELREKEFPIIYKGKPLEVNKLTNLIIKWPKLFKVLEKLDTKRQTVVAPVTSKLIKISLWPITSLLTMAYKQSDNKSVDKFLKKQINLLNKLSSN